MTKRIAILLALVLTIPCPAKVLTVDDNGPADYRTIQAAIDGAWHGDTVVVKEGTYRERVAFNGRQITVRSEDPSDAAVVAATVISANAAAGVVFDFAEGEKSVLTGLTVTGAGILCIASSPTISGNVIRNCSGAGIKGQNGAKPAILDNRILDNALEGVYSCDGLIQGNIVSGNRAGLAFCSGSILDNVISDNRDSGGLSSCNGQIAGNTITGNYSATQGGGLYQCAGDIHHNIISGNQALRQGGGLHSCTKAIFSNTIVGNRAGDAGGAISQCQALVYNNIIAFNEAPVAGGLHGEAVNTYNAYWSNPGGNLGGGALSGLGEIVAEPLFVSSGLWDDNGTTSAADDSWLDGDYHLRSQAGRWDVRDGRWVADSETSYCIDAGKASSNWAQELWPHGKRINLGAYGGTAEASMSRSDVGRPADLDHDEKVAARDLVRFSQSWLTAQNPAAADLDRRGAVDFNDFAILAMEWRTGSTATQTPPIPSPMSFAVAPFATGPYSIAMVATTATSTDGTGVEYYFEDFFTPEVNSGWLSYAANEEPRWEDVGLTPHTMYWYRVKARNQGNRLETEWSMRQTDITPLEDFTSPTPNPLTWQTEPHGVAAGTIRMVATTAVDDSGVEYQFECTSHPVYSSGWQDAVSYEAAGLPKGYYKFRVRARDKSRNHNITNWSAEVAVDLLAPTPDPMTWTTEPKEVRIGTGTFDYYAKMTAAEATDDSGKVEYYFQCTTESGFDSGWQKSRDYSVKVGRSGQRHRFRVKARDLSPSYNETAWSTELPSK
jgi:hypothetical protein